MEIKVNGIKYELKDKYLIKSGGEGTIYTLKFGSEIKCVKIYFSDKRTTFNERKIFTLINKFEALRLGNIENDLAYPEALAYDALTNRFCGFVMKFFDSHTPVAELLFSKNANSYGSSDYYDEDIIQFVDNLFHYLRILHRVGIILGDINPENILINRNTNNPAIVDMDSCQLGNFYSTTHRKDYFDPSVKIDGYGKNKYFIYSTESDILSLSIIAYELIVGSNPYFFQTRITTGTHYKREAKLSFLDYSINHATNPHLATHDVFRNSLYFSSLERLEFLRINHFEIFSFFKAIFVDEKRYYFYYKKKKEIIIKKRSGKTSVQEVELLAQTKEDPKEVELFLKQFHLPIF